MKHPILDVNRIIYSQTHPKAAKTLIFIGGIHGNEPAGILGLQKVIKSISEHKIQLHCNFYALAGNLNAIQKNIRFETTDLNRLWTHENIAKIESKTTFAFQEEKELSELYACIKTILSTHTGSFIFTDLHTTSAETIPFVTISDSLKNRQFVSNLKIPIILGIEEYLNGPLLTYINEFGHVALGFEAGQHTDPKAVENCEAFIWRTLLIAKAVDKFTLAHLECYSKITSNEVATTDFYEISDRYQLKSGEDFKMNAGFKNFDSIQKSQNLARSNEEVIKASVGGRIFMPLYQSKGDDGFFIITKISSFWLQLSSVFRKLNLHHILRILPGVQQHKANANALIVNPKIAAFLTTKIFHLFGYRKKVLKTDVWYFVKRD